MMLAPLERPKSFVFSASFIAFDDRCVAEDAPDYSRRPHQLRASNQSSPGASSKPASAPETGAQFDTEASSGIRIHPHQQQPDLGEVLVSAARTVVHSEVQSRITEGIALRLAAELIDGTRLAATDRAANVARLRDTVDRVSGAAPEPDTDEGVAQRLKSLARAGDRLIAEQVRLLVRFADAELYKLDGCRTMAMWMGVHLGLGESTATERLRIGRALKELPVCESFFALGKLTLSQLRHIVRHASAATDLEFAEATTNLSVPATEDYCRRFRHEEDADEDAANADAHGTEASAALAALRAHGRRSLTVREIDGHSTRILLTLPTDMAADFLRSLEHAEDWIREGGEDDEAGVLAEGHGAAPGTPGDSTVADPASGPGATVAEKPTACQIRADAAVLVGRRSLAHAGEAVAVADRYRVHVNIDARDLAELPIARVGANAGAVKAVRIPDEVRVPEVVRAIEASDETEVAEVLAKPPSIAISVPVIASAPIERLQVQGHGPISRATARRLAERSGFTLHAMDDAGHPVGAIKKAPLFGKRQLRAMRARDRCCQVPGCGSTRYLEGHHVVHRAHGGGSGIECGAIVCGGCHRLLHEGGFRLERVTAAELDAELEVRFECAGSSARRRNAIRPGAPGPDAAQWSAAARARIAAKLSRVRRYRLIDANGEDCASPRKARQAGPGEGDGASVR